MKHLTEEEFVQQYYREEQGKRDRDAHLEKCQECREELTQLALVLDTVAQMPVPERGQEYGQDVWARVSPQLVREEQRGWSWAGWRPWAAALTMAALVILAFALGRYTKPAVPTQDIARHEKSKDEKVLMVALGDHLDRSQMILVELVNASSDGEVDISTEQRRAEDLIASNRIFRQAAVRTGDADVANVLDDLERVLVEVAHEPSKLDSAEMKRFRQRIEAKGILFKVRVVGANVRSAQGKPSESQSDSSAPAKQRKTT